MKTIPETKKTHCGCLIAFLIVVIISLLVVPLLLRGIGAMLIYADPLKEADAAVALTGDKGARVAEAAKLMGMNYVEYLYITFTDETARDTLLWQANQAGIPADLIVVTEMQVNNTVDEARAVKKLATQRGNDSLMIITDPFHTLRTRIIFKKVFAGSGIKIQVRPVGNHWYRSNTWWRTSEGRMYTLEEYFKIFMFYLGKY